MGKERGCEVELAGAYLLDAEGVEEPLGELSIGKPEHPDGERPARDGLGSEFTWLMRRAQSALVRPSKLVPLGRTFLSSTWLRSQEPFCWDCLTSQ